MWGLASLERRLGVPSLSPSAVIDRLKLRYDREVGTGERSVLRRVLERDEGAGVPMVLAVAAVVRTALTLTDGWYSLPCPLEGGAPLTRLVAQGRVREGTKLLTQGAELVGGEEGCHPLEAAGRQLRLQVNSTRRVRWRQRLGKAAPLAVDLASLLPGGGTAPLLRLRVARRYPLLYCVKEQGGKSLFLSEREWEVREQGRGSDASLHALYREVEERLAREEAPPAIRVRERELRGVTCGEQLYTLVAGSGDPGLAAILTREQREAMEEVARCRKEELRRRVEEEVQEKMRSMRGGQATPLLRLRLVDVCGERRRSAILTIWRPGAGVAELVEGREVGVTGAQVARVEAATVHLTASRSTQYLDIEGCEPADQEEVRRITALATVCRPTFAPVFGEVDVVVVVVRVEGLGRDGFHSTVVTDASGGAVRLLTWGGRGAEALQEGRVLVARDLEWRTRHSPGPFPRLYLREASSLASHPRQAGARRAVEELQAALAKDPRILARAREAMVIQASPDTPRRHALALAPSRHPALREPTTPPAATAWGVRSVAAQQARSREKVAAVEAYSSRMAAWGGAMPPPPSPSPTLVSPKPAAPYRTPQPSQRSAETQEMEELAVRTMEEMDL